MKPRRVADDAALFTAWSSHDSIAGRHFLPFDPQASVRLEAGPSVYGPAARESAARRCLPPLTIAGDANGATTSHRVAPR
jgi:hypothetical protein